MPLVLDEAVASHGSDAYHAETASSWETIPYEGTQREWEASPVELLILLQKMSDEQLHTALVLT